MSGMQGISVKLPLIYSNVDGPYALNKNIGEVVRQNFKNLLLTSPGERIMLPDFGCGLRRLLFSNITPALYSQISVIINEQVNKYMPFVNIEDIQLLNMDDNENLGINEISVSVTYNIGSLDSQDTIRIS
jgi:phage baseplate assembly protein W